MGSTWVYSLQKIVITTLTSKKNTRNNLCSAWIPCFFLVLKRFTLSIVIQFFLSFFLQRRRYLPRWWRDKAVTASLEVFGGGEIGLDRCCSSCSWWYDQKTCPYVFFVSWVSCEFITTLPPSTVSPTISFACLLHFPLRFDVFEIYCHLSLQKLAPFLYLNTMNFSRTITCCLLWFDRVKMQTYNIVLCFFVSWVCCIYLKPTIHFASDNKLVCLSYLP